MFDVEAHKTMKIEFQQIGVIHTPYLKLEGMPLQPAGALGVQGTVEVFEEFQSGLKDLDGFSHIILVYYFHQSKNYNLHVVPFMDSKRRGLFSTRAPNRPNNIGISTVKLEKIEKRILYVQNIDILNGTALLDIKPYIPEFDVQSHVRTGWLEKVRGKVSEKRSDDRFKLSD
jgi:tRNA-Thr(GGU) m(6)t(6)A37 methyltransferase TsaA